MTRENISQRLLQKGSVQFKTRIITGRSELTSELTSLDLEWPGANIIWTIKVTAAIVKRKL